MKEPESKANYWPVVGLVQIGTARLTKTISCRCGLGWVCNLKRADSNWNLAETAAMRKTRLVIGEMLKCVAHLPI